ncbi:MAG: phosphoribosylformylglycinamidine synthase [Methylococcaceae bacterium]|nr:phosphoribosylformylglycinamidine synthase [Methylococcaceae bacterium]
MFIKKAGASALSLFRLQKLCSELRKLGPAIQAIQARYVHYIDTESELDPAATAILDRLLEYGEAPIPSDFEAQETLIFVPRPGTISPWSSKATEIARRCGLEGVARIERGCLYAFSIGQGEALGERAKEAMLPLLHDRMTQVLIDASGESGIFRKANPGRLQRIELEGGPSRALAEANQRLGLALSRDELDYLAASFQALGRDPSDVELMMFAQANSEHCRHKIFNAGWTIDGRPRSRTLFDMIRFTSDTSPRGILSAYHDNAAVMEGHAVEVFYRDPETHEYRYRNEAVEILMKVETHNHPTAISPFPGSATGSGGEIRDEGATGRGSSTKAGLCGFSVSNLRIPGLIQPWESDSGKPERIASGLDIMLQGPIGGAAFNNEFGRPNLAGYFRTFECAGPGTEAGLRFGYHKPIMIAGGMGSIRAPNIEKRTIPEGAMIVVLGGPAMLIGIGGGAASSQATGAGSEFLDFASVQRENPEMQRRCQEVINRCSVMQDNPILSIHDVGAGGLSNAVPEILRDSGRGGWIELAAIPSADGSMSPLEIWCNEAQERYVLAVNPDTLALFSSICEREHCPFAVIGRATEAEHLVLYDRASDSNVIDIPMSLLFGKPPKMHRSAKTLEVHTRALDLKGIQIQEAARRVLQLPAVGSKNFLITIGDRSITGLVARDQMVGPWQVPVADVAVTASGFHSDCGEAMAIGERTPLAIMDAPASGRMAVGEAITNLAAASIESLGCVKLSANWMAAAGSEGQDAALYQTVRAVGIELCPELGIAIPVGKDSLSMKTIWSQDGRERVVIAPVSLIVSAFACVPDIRRTLTPQLVLDQGDTDLILIDLGQGRNRLGGSALAQVYSQVGSEPPDLDDAGLFKSFFRCIQALNQQRKLLAYHDRSDGGLFVTVCEMAFAARCGLRIELEGLGPDPLAAMFAEELGAVIQVRRDETPIALSLLDGEGLSGCRHVIGRPDPNPMIRFEVRGQALLAASRAELQQVWSRTSFQMQSLRDNPECAVQEFAAIGDDSDPGLNPRLSFRPRDHFDFPVLKTRKPAVAILREQGVNGHVEMAAAFDAAGFSCIDVHMNDLMQGLKDLGNFVGLAACGGFSYGDVLGAGRGWSHSILLNPRVRDQFSEFFSRSDTFALGVCNGCQMMSGLTEIIPGAEHWPKFKRNRSEQFEARVVMVEVQTSPSIFFQGMEGSRIPVCVAHGEGRAEFSVDPNQAPAASAVALRYTNNFGQPTEAYPFNPNGSPSGIAGLTSKDGRFTILMPHPERSFKTFQHTWGRPDWGEFSPWMRFFRNARTWIA